MFPCLINWGRGELFFEMPSQGGKGIELAECVALLHEPEWNAFCNFLFLWCFFRKRQHEERTGWAKGTSWGHLSPGCWEGDQDCAVTQNNISVFWINSLYGWEGPLCNQMVWLVLVGRYSMMGLFRIGVWTGLPFVWGWGHGWPLSQWELGRFGPWGGWEGGWDGHRTQQGYKGMFSCCTDRSPACLRSGAGAMEHRRSSVSNCSRRNHTLRWVGRILGPVDSHRDYEPETLKTSWAGEVSANDPINKGHTLLFT